MSKPWHPGNRLAISRALGALLFLVILASQPAIVKGAWREITESISLLLIAFGVLGRLWATLYIGGQKDRTLIVDGPYSICRNPLYFFSLVGGLGVMLATGIMSLTILLAVFFAIYYPWIIRNEERRLLQIHGAAFEAYRQRTPAFFPKPSLYRDPPTCVFDPKLVRKALRDCSGFFLAFVAIELIALTQSIHVLPVVLTLP